MLATNLLVQLAVFNRAKRSHPLSDNPAYRREQDSLKAFHTQKFDNDNDYNDPPPPFPLYESTSNDKGIVLTHAIAPRTAIPFKSRIYDASEYGV